MLAPLRLYVSTLRLSFMLVSLRFSVILASLFTFLSSYLKYPFSFFFLPSVRLVPVFLSTLFSTPFSFSYVTILLFQLCQPLFIFHVLLVLLSFLQLCWYPIFLSYLKPRFLLVTVVPPCPPPPPPPPQVLQQCGGAFFSACLAG